MRLSSALHTVFITAFHCAENTQLYAQSDCFVFFRDLQYFHASLDCFFGKS